MSGNNDPNKKSPAKRLDPAFQTSSTKWMAYVFLVFVWGITIQGLATGNHRVIPFCYIFPIPTVLILWWVSSLKNVTLDGDTLIIRDSRREAHIPLSQVARVAEHRLGKGFAHITIVFKSETEFGRRVRIMTGTYALDRIARILRNAMEGKNVEVRVNHVPHGTSPAPANQKEVFVSGWTDEELLGILTDFANIYDGALGPDFDYEVQPHDKGSIRITFPHDIPALQFSFLVNYVQYPKDYDLEMRSISVVGKAPITPEFHCPNKSLVGQNAIFYVPPDDQSYDLVYVRIGSDTFENSFAARRWKKVTVSKVPKATDEHDRKG